MSSEGKNKSNTNKQAKAALSMTRQTAKRQKLSTEDNSTSETVELDLTNDCVPLKTGQMTHEFMSEISTLNDDQITECVPKTLKLLEKFRETNSQTLTVCTTKLTEVLLTALFSEVRTQTSTLIPAPHPWGAQNPNLKLFTLLKLEDYDWENLSTLAIMESIMTEANADKEILDEAEKSTSTTTSIGETCAEKLIIATHKKIETGVAEKIEQEGSTFTSFPRTSTLFGSTEDLNPEAINTMLSVFEAKLNTQEVAETHREGAGKLEIVITRMVKLERLLSVLDAKSEENIIPHVKGNLIMSTIKSAPAVFSTTAKVTTKLTAFLKQLLKRSNLAQAKLDNEPEEEGPHPLAKATQEYNTFSQLNGGTQHQNQSATSTLTQLTEQVAIQSEVREGINEMAKKTLIEGGAQVCKLVLSSKLTDNAHISNRTNIQIALLSITVSNIVKVCAATGISISRACAHHLMLCDLVKIPLNKMYPDSTDNIFADQNPTVKPEDLVFRNSRQLIDCFNTCMRLLQTIYGKEWCDNQCRDFAHFLSLFSRGRSHSQIEGCLAMILRDWANRVQGWLADNEKHVPEICGKAGVTTGHSYHTLTACTERTRSVVNALMSTNVQLMIAQNTFFRDSSVGTQTIDLNKLPELTGAPTASPEELQENVDLMAKQLSQMKKAETKLTKQVSDQAKKLADHDKKVNRLERKEPKNKDDKSDDRNKKEDRRKVQYPPESLPGANGESIHGVTLPSTPNFTRENKGKTWCDDKNQKSGFRLLGQDAPCTNSPICNKFQRIGTCHKRHDDAKDRTGKNYDWKKERSYERK